MIWFTLEKRPRPFSKRVRSGWRGTSTTLQALAERAKSGCQSATAVLPSPRLSVAMRRLAQPEGSAMGKTIAIGFLAASLCAAPLQAEPANPVSSAITKPNNDAALRKPHLPPVRQYRRPRPHQPNKSP